MDWNKDLGQKKSIPLMVKLKTEHAVNIEYLKSNMLLIFFAAIDWDRFRLRPNAFFHFLCLTVFLF